MTQVIRAFQGVIFHNLFSFEKLPIPGQLVSVPYPNWDDGEPVEPALLERHSLTTGFEFPKCYHSRATQVIAEDSSNGTIFYLTCARPEPCSFSICINDILANPQLLSQTYDERRYSSDSDTSMSSTACIAFDSGCDTDSENELCMVEEMSDFDSMSDISDRSISEPETTRNVHQVLGPSNPPVAFASQRVDNGDKSCLLPLNPSDQYADIPLALSDRSNKENIRFYDGQADVKRRRLAVYNSSPLRT